MCFRAIAAPETERLCFPPKEGVEAWRSERRILGDEPDHRQNFRDYKAR